MKRSKTMEFGVGLFMLAGIIAGISRPASQRLNALSAL